MPRTSWASMCAARWAWRSGSMKAWTLGAEGTTGLITYMRTDSPRVAPEAIAGAREWVAKQLGAKYLPETPNVYKGKKDAQDAHEAIRPTDASRTPESIARYLTRRATEAVHADLAAICGLADGSRGVRRDDGEYCREVGEDRQDLRFSRERIGAALRWLPEGLRGCGGQEGRGRRVGEQAAQPGRREDAGAGEAGARGALYPAASALQRSLAGEGAGRARHRPAVDLCVDHQHHSGSRVCGEARRIARTLLSHRDRRGGVRSAGGEFSLHLRHRLHGQAGDGAGRHRGRHGEVDRSAERLLRTTSSRSSRTPARTCATSSAWRK